MNNILTVQTILCKERYLLWYIKDAIPYCLELQTFVKACHPEQGEGSLGFNKLSIGHKSAESREILRHKCLRMTNFIKFIITDSRIFNIHNKIKRPPD